MKRLLLTLPLFTGITLANSLSPTDVLPLPEPAPAPVEARNQTPPEYDFSDERALYHNPLQGILAFVCDKASADAAAPRVKALVASAPEGEKLVAAPESWLFLYFGSGCFGSGELMEAMRPLLPEELATAERFRNVATPFLNEFVARLDSLSATVEQVKEPESAAKAAEALDALPAFLEEWGKRTDAAIAKAIPLSELNRDDAYFILALQQVYPLPAVERLRHAWWKASARTDAVSPELNEAMQKAWRPLGDIPGVRLEPKRITPGVPDAEEQLSTALREWMGVASTITDKESADAAADWLEAKNAALGHPLLESALKASYDGCSYSSFLATLQEPIYSYFELALPAWFGSEKLQKLMEEHSQESLMPVPAVVPLREPDADEDAAGEE